MKRQSPKSKVQSLKSSGFSLLEVVLALAILTAAIAVLGELVRSGLRNAQLARDLSQAELLCESTILQIESGQIPSQSTGQTPIAEFPGWSYSIEPASASAAGGQGGSGPSGLLTLRITVEQSRDQQARPARFSVVRWMRDPSLVITQQTTQQALLPQTTSSTTSSTMLGTGVY